MNIFSRTVAALAVAATTLANAGHSHATAFAAWQVANVPFGDTLNVRKYPSGTSQKQAAYPNGTVLQMTGKCTGGINSAQSRQSFVLAAETEDPQSLVPSLA